MSQLRIERSRAEHSGKGLALFAAERLAADGLTPGDTVTLRTRFGRLGLARVGPALPAGADAEAVALDQYTRQGLKARLGDTVEVGRLSGLPPVERILLSPLLDVSRMSGLGDYLRQSFGNQRLPAFENAVLYTAFPGASFGWGAGAGPGHDHSDGQDHGHSHEEGEDPGHQHPRGGGAASTGWAGIAGAPFQVLELSPGPGEITPRTAIELKYAHNVGPGTAPDVTYEDVGGMDLQIRQARELIETPIRYPNVFRRLGINPPRGIIFHGPPGSGKTHLARAIANELEAKLFYISGPEVISSTYGETEANLRRIFQEASSHFPSIIFVDELDVIAPKRGESGSAADTRMSTQFLTLLDGIKRTEGVMVIGTTNRVDSVDLAFRRPGRFDREIYVGAPDAAGRLEIIAIHTRGMPLTEGAFDYLPELARVTVGFVGADFMELCREAGLNALRRRLPTTAHTDLRNFEVPLESLTVEASDFEEALARVRPSALRETLVVATDTRWEAVAGLEAAKERLREVVEQPLLHPDVFAAMRVVPPRGVLLFGPPGTGKSLLARAVARACNANFVPVRGPEFFSKFLGESEERVRRIFATARQVAPCIIFLDQLDALAPARTGETGPTAIIQRVVNTLLTELDAIDPRRGIMVIGATNRIDLIDEAVLTPDRFGVHIHVPLPTETERQAIVALQLADVPLAAGTAVTSVSARIADQTSGFSGAELAALCEEAKMIALREAAYTHAVPLSERHLLTALDALLGARAERAALAEARRIVEAL